MNEVQLNMEIETDAETEKLCEEAAAAVIHQVLATQACPMDALVSLTLTESESIRAVNRDFRGLDRETDVLSFPTLEFPNGPGDFSWIEDHEADCLDPESGCLCLGDIVLNMDRVYSQADLYGHSWLREYAFLIAHSMLHLCGYDHMEEDEAALMEEQQDRVLTAIGLVRDASLEEMTSALFAYRETMQDE